MVGNWTERKVGNVKMIHHSTSSVIEIIIEQDDEKITVWLDYTDFENLKKALKLTDDE